MFTSLFQLEQKPVTVFSSDDAGAPVLTKDPGSLKTLLKACLVTGYGDKTALGWQMLFESADTKSAAFASQDPTASKYVIKINNSATTSAKISAYQSMTDIDTGIKPMAVDNEYELFDGAWRLVGHGKAFVLLLNAKVYGGDNVAYPIVFGDVPRPISRANPIAVFWTARKSQYWNNGLQSTLQSTPDGNTSDRGNTATYPSEVPNYPFVVSNAQSGTNIRTATSKFNASARHAATLLYDMYIFSLPDGVWSCLPMMQPLSAIVPDIPNLGRVNDNAIKARTSGFALNTFNPDCVVPTDWWWA